MSCSPEGLGWTWNMLWWGWWRGKICLWVCFYQQYWSENNAAPVPDLWRHWLSWKLGGDTWQTNSTIQADRRRTHCRWRKKIENSPIRTFWLGSLKCNTRKTKSQQYFLWCVDWRSFVSHKKAWWWPDHISVRLLKSSSNWTKSSMMGPQLFLGWYQMILDVFRCSD